MLESLVNQVLDDRIPLEQRRVKKYKQSAWINGDLITAINIRDSKHVAKSLMCYLVSNDLLYELQSAFRKGHSTETALIKLTDQIQSNMDQDKVTGVVFIDFGKAFDVLGHQMLLKKRKLYIESATLPYIGLNLILQNKILQFVTIDSQKI